MKSIREIYKIGKGPSSSHTMGPERAAKLFLQRCPQAERFEVILYGSLNKTGIGHGTDNVLKETLGFDRTKIIYSPLEWEGMHPNTLDFKGFADDKEVGFLRVESIGGGDIRVPGEPAAAAGEEVYIEHSFAEIHDFCKWRYIDTLSEYVELNEGPEIWDFLMEVWQTMKTCIEEGLQAEGILPGGLKLRRKAKELKETTMLIREAGLQEFHHIAAYAFAVAEQNADGGTIVTAPTCGACGVMPAALLFMQQDRGFSDEEMIRALAVGGLIGNLIKHNASISGAQCGCQAEIGSACSMTAAALAELFGMGLDQIDYAAEVAMEHHLGLTCDPIGGLVQIPCIERNAVAAMRAINALSLANFLSSTSKISFDMVVDTMYETGRDLNRLYRETAEGGLAKKYRF